MREVCADAAAYFDPTRADELAERLRTLLTDEAQRLRLREAGRRRLASYSWQAAAERHLAAIREVVQP